MAYLVREDARELALVLSVVEEPGVDLDAASEERRGVELGIRYEEEVEGEAHAVGGGDELLPDAGEVLVDDRVVCYREHPPRLAAEELTEPDLLSD